MGVAFPELRIERYDFAGEGWDSTALLVNGEYIFRFAKRPDVALRQAREAELLPLLADRLPLSIPRYTHVWSDPAWPGARIVGYRLIPGDQIFADRARPEHRAEQAAQLGEFLSALHAIPLEEAQRCGVLGGDAEKRRAAYRGFYEKVREDMPPLFDSSAQAAIVAFWSGYLDDDACFTFASTLTHRDLNTEHILHDPTTGKLTGVIDWGDASIDDPALDFVAVWTQLGEDFSRQMLVAYQHTVDATFFRRIESYAGMEPFHEIHFGQLEGDAAHLEHGVAWARRIFTKG